MSPADEYERSDSEYNAFMRLAADDFRQSAATEQEQRAAIFRYFRRRFAARYANGELIDYLGISSPSVLGMADYPDDAAQRVMDMLADITDEAIQSTIL